MATLGACQHLLLAFQTLGGYFVARIELRMKILAGKLHLDKLGAYQPIPSIISQHPLYLAFQILGGIFHS